MIELRGGSIQLTVELLHLRYLKISSPLIFVLILLMNGGTTRIISGHPSDDDDPVGEMLHKIQTGQKRKDLVFYNRVPKTGSSTIQAIADKLSIQLGFNARHFIQPPGIRCSR